MIFILVVKLCSYRAGMFFFLRGCLVGLVSES